MYAFWKRLSAAACLIFISCLAYAQETDWLKGSVDDELRTLSGIPLLGPLMIDYSLHFTNMYYAAQNGKWDLADYHRKEALEIQMVAETIRPEQKADFEAFQNTYLNPLAKAIDSKDFQAFETAFASGTAGCNACHATQGFPFLRYQLPKAPISEGIE